VGGAWNLSSALFALPSSATDVSAAVMDLVAVEVRGGPVPVPARTLAASREEPR